ncbi:MAG TPA: glycosyltransferase family 2 protein [Flavobacterium sp.]|jgi:glycosyltransferase involved in cell wall biosynthesis
MTTSPFFSIITASFNSEKTIAATIQSVLDQSFTDFEYVIIDGDSSDGTLVIIKSFEQNFQNKNVTYTYISEKDKGIYDAWNKGLALSKGNWISFLGSDDEYLPDALQLYHDKICVSDINYISSQVELVNRHKKRLSVFGKPFVWEKLIHGMDTAQVGSLHKRELFDQVGNFDVQYRIVGDLDFYFRCKDVIRPEYIAAITAKMQNEGVSNQIYKALREALQVKLHYRYAPAAVSYFEFYRSLLKCYIKIAFKKK